MLSVSVRCDLLRCFENIHKLPLLGHKTSGCTWEPMIAFEPKSLKWVLTSSSSQFALTLVNASQIEPTPLSPQSCSEKGQQRGWVVGKTLLRSLSQSPFKVSKRKCIVLQMELSTWLIQKVFKVLNSLLFRSLLSLNAIPFSLHHTH